MRGKITNLLDSRSYKETKASEARKWANQMWRVFIEFVLLSPRVLIPDDLQETYFFYLVKKRCPEIRNSVSIIKNITMQDVADTLKSSGQTMQDGKVHLSNQRNLCVLMNAVVTLAVLRSNNQIAKCLQKIGKATKRFQKMDAQDPDVARSAQEISTQLAAMQQIVKDAGAIREAGREGNPVLTLNSGICTVGKCKTHLERLVETSKYIERRSKECSSKIVSITRDAIVKEQGKLSFFNRLKTKFWY